jgi:hypothetical protein
MSSEDYEYQLKMYEHEKEICRIKNEHISFLNDVIKSSTESQCKAILTFSSASLAVSIAFIRIIEGAQYLYLIKIAWVLFALAVLLVIFSYFIDVDRIRNEMDKIERFDPKFSERDTVLESNKVPFNIIKSAAISFGSALFFLVFFASLNI